MPEHDGLSRHPAYLDHHATTPVDQRVLEAMLPFFRDVFGNASSIDHIYGAEASKAVETARQQVAKLINAKPVNGGRKWYQSRVENGGLKVYHPM